MQVLTLLSDRLFDTLQEVSQQCSYTDTVIAAFQRLTTLLQTLQWTLVRYSSVLASVESLTWVLAFQTLTVIALALMPLGKTSKGWESLEKHAKHARSAIKSLIQRTIRFAASTFWSLIKFIFRCLAYGIMTLLKCAWRTFRYSIKAVYHRVNNIQWVRDSGNDRRGYAMCLTILVLLPCLLPSGYYLCQAMFQAYYAFCLQTAAITATYTRAILAAKTGLKPIAGFAVVALCFAVLFFGSRWYTKCQKKINDFCYLHEEAINRLLIVSAPLLMICTLVVRPLRVKKMTHVFQYMLVAQERVPSQVLAYPTFDIREVADHPQEVDTYDADASTACLRQPYHFADSE
ncbi:MAG: hypothetical protein Q9209_007737 [Squamulea sp. 1 TL-2023]